MKFLEKDLEQIIYESDKEKLSEKGLFLFGNLKRQLRIGNYGICDLLNYKRPFYHAYFGHVVKGEINILELKSEKIGVSTFFQALNYLKGVRTYLESKGIEDHYNYRITLIGRTVDLNSSFCYLSEMFNPDSEDLNLYETSVVSVDLYTYSFDIDGIVFKEIYGYNLIDKGF